LTGSPIWIARFAALGYPEHFYLVVGAMEVIGAVALVIPRFRFIGFAVLGIVMIGASVSHALHGQIQIVTTLVLLGLLVADAFAHRRRTSSTLG
jgi:uncharacterized membrane protein YphA (DoxX/SURF4 family)